VCRVLFLTSENTPPTENPVYCHLVGQPHTEVTIRTDNLNLKLGELHGRFDFCVSYGYRFIIKQPILNLFPTKVVNLHISYIPWNRGADPNLWSLLSGTPSGVSIHDMDAGVDTGNLIAQRAVPFDHSMETLGSSYNKLKLEIEELFVETWPNIRKGDAPRTVNPAAADSSAGSIHRVKDKADFFDRVTPNGCNTELAQVLKLYQDL
jgi:methionyl-tRNA formyltransferase